MMEKPHRSYPSPAEDALLPVDAGGKRVLIMSTAAGSGHIRAAQALEKTFAGDARVAEVINQDALRYTNKIFRNFYSKLYAQLVESAPNFLGWWYKTSDEPWRTDRMRNMIDRLNTKPLVRFIRAFDPHITVCTHFLPAGIISHLIATRQIQARLSIVVTDYDFHAMWLSRAFQRYFVALDETVEWSRVQPTHQSAAGDVPPFDPTALDAYARMVADCIAHGLEPIVTLHHFVHPAWLGPDAWLQPDTAEHFVAFVRTSVSHINRTLVASGRPPLRYYITINEPGMLVLNTYLGNQFPAGANRTVDAALRACNQLLRAHILAYNCIHDLYAAEGWAEPRVTLNSFTSDLYGSDKMFFDLLAMRERQVRPYECQGYIRSQAAGFNRFISQSGIHEHNRIQHLKGTLLRTISRHLLGRYIGCHTFSPVLETLYQSRRERVMDYIAMDYYDPFCAHAFRFPIWWDHEFRSTHLRDWIMNSITSKWWDWRVLPKGMRLFCEYYAAEYDHRPLLIAENGLAQRRGFDNRAYLRGDRISRSEFIRSHAGEVIDMVSTGIPLLGYLHWSLFDNYEWGTYAPRFGIFSLDYASGTARVATDPWGDCPSATYAKIIRSAEERWKREKINNAV